MTGKELRIGNIISHKNEAVEVSSIESSDYCTVMQVGGSLFAWTRCIDSFSPAILTHEWILRFGFIKFDTLDSKSAFYFIEYYGGNLFQLLPSDDAYFFGEDLATCKIRYVHQLQNLFFAFTGEELKIIEAHEYK